MATWNETVERFTHVADRLGKPIDAGIFETVVALNLLGIRTVQSCEGHVGWGVPYPWVHIETDLEQKFLLHQHLAQFYTRRCADFDCILVFHGYRLHSRGATFSELYSPEQQRQKLNAYQAEMCSFTAFMKSLLDL